MSNASTFRAFARIERQTLSAILPSLPTGDRNPFIYRSDRRGEILASVGGTRLVRQEA